MKITQTTVKDIEAGKRDKAAGYYDKWYRYNRKDDGAAYDAGFNAANSKHVMCAIIECVESKPMIEQERAFTFTF